jgi:gamma-glutamyltranspeptidase/glutathione hydrolase
MTKVVVCPERYAAEAGMEILRKDGNAVDAVVAGSLAQGVTNPLLCSAGGCGQMNIYMVKNRKPIFASTDAGVGSRGNQDVYEYEGEVDPSAPFVGRRVKNHEDEIGYKAFITPDLFQVLYDAHKRFGRLPWKDCLRPAAKLAKEGFIVDAYLLKMGFNEKSLPTFYATQEMAKIYLNDGRPYREGELLVQKDYGNTIDQVAEHGPDIFYRGEIAEKITEDFEEHGALVTGEDLRDVRTIWYEPMTSTYKDITFYVNIPPSGGPFKLEILNILEGFDLRKLGWNTAEYLDIVARTMNVAFADRFLYSVDPIVDPESMKNAQMLISKDYAAKMIDMIKKGKDKEYAAPNMAPYDEGTTHIVTLDDEGNCVSMKHSSGSSAGVVTPGVGIPYNNHMTGLTMFVGHKRTKDFGFKPRMKPCGGMSPMLGFKNGRLYSASGSPAGHNGYMCEIQSLINVIEFGFRVQAAVSSPRIYSGELKNEVVVEPSFPYPYPFKNLEAKGHRLRVTPYSGRVSALVIDPVTGYVDVGTDPRGGGGLAREG